MKLVLASNNRGKLAELQAMLHVLEECLSELNADQERALMEE